MSFKKTRDWRCPNCQAVLNGTLPSERIDTQLNCYDCNAELQIMRRDDGVLELIMLND